MMSRRKRTLVPQKIDDEKRLRLSWNMMDCAQNVGNCNQTFLTDDNIPNGTDGQQVQDEDTSDNNRASLLNYCSVDCELKLDNSATVKKSFGRLGTFSGVFLSRESLHQAQDPRENGVCNSARSGPIIKLCGSDKERTKIVSECNISCQSIHWFADIANHSDFIQVDATIEQLDALSYLQTKGLVSVSNEEIEGNEKDRNSIELSVYLNQAAFSKVTLPNEDPHLRSRDKMMKILVSWFHGTSISKSATSTECSELYDEKLEVLFDTLKKLRGSCTTNSCDILNNPSEKLTDVSAISEDKDLETLQHPSLAPSLRRYQMKSVRWMICRETVNMKFRAENCELHPLWKEITIGNELVYYNPFTGRISLDKCYHKGYPSGGILADEMGLGKTVEVLACVLNHPMNESTKKTGEHGNEFIENMLKEEKTSVENALPSDSFTVEFQKDPPDCREVSVKHFSVDIESETSEESASTFLSGSRTTYDSINDPANPFPTNGQKNDHHALEHLDGVVGEQTESGQNSVKRQTFMEIPVVQEEISVRCVCGNNTTTDTSQEELLMCSRCNFVQHSTCIGVKPNDGNHYVCPDCVVKMPVIDSRATLIISPVTIAHQWLDEIHRHILPGSLDVLVYEGVSNQGFIYPSVLADNDVILTTYDALKKDFHHLATNKAGQDRRSRHRKRYASWPCPLTCIKFWRICLDEAQMVESTTAKAAETALNLLAVHRWCVTGTPIQRGVEDLYGLLLFLGVEPYYRKTWWKKLLHEPFLKGNSKPLLDVLYHIMWRTAKKDVINEINLPDQGESVKWFYFSPVEDHFYRRQHEECSSSALKELNKFHESMTKLNSLDKNSVQKVMGPLLRLRQACCHPQAVRGCFLSFQKSTITMEQLLETLIAKAKKESEEAHRLLLCAMNGLAGTYILQENLQQAVDTYREAMGSWREHEELMKTDSLQKLHTLHNLHEILNHGFSGCSRTLRDDFLEKEASELSEKYLEKWRDQVAIAKADVFNAQNARNELTKKVDFKCPWWIIFLEDILNPDKNSSERKLSERLVEKVKDDLATINNAGESLSMADSFSDLRGLRFLLVTRLDAIEKCHANLMIELEKLCVEPSKEIITSVAECCLRPVVNNRTERCRFCGVDEIFSSYESLLFGHHGVNAIDQENQQTAVGLRGETETERSLKSIYNFLRTQNKHDEKFVDLQQQAQSHFEYLDLMKKNFKTYRQLWFALREHVSALDELEMCTTRLRLRFPGEVVEENQIHIINPIEIGAVQMKFRSDKVVANSNLRKSLGQLLYLKNLAKTQIKDGGENLEPCPVCTKSLSFQWNVFSCGHCLCCQCMWILLNQPGIVGRAGARIKCPMCRAPTLIQDISYVSTVTEKSEDEKNISVKGSHSTKIEAITRTLLKIQRSDPLAKTLVFSTWQDVLEHISYALTENGINFRRIKGRKDFQESLEEFKTADNISVLLLPLQSGSNGLNIIEATHVILVEPSLNPSLERQAVGRIHRIGQTKPTFVHRLLIGNTVEEKIMNFLQTKTVSGIRCGTRRTDKDVIPLTVGELASFFEQPTETLSRAANV